MNRRGFLGALIALPAAAKAFCLAVPQKVKNLWHGAPCEPNCTSVTIETKPNASSYMKIDFPHVKLIPHDRFPEDQAKFVEFAINKAIQS